MWIGRVEVLQVKAASRPYLLQRDMQAALRPSKPLNPYRYVPKYVDVPHGRRRWSPAMPSAVSSGRGIVTPV